MREGERKKKKACTQKATFSNFISCSHINLRKPVDLQVLGKREKGVRGGGEGGGLLQYR